MLNSGKKYSNSCVVRKQISVRNKKTYPPPLPLQVKWSVPKVYGEIFVMIRKSKNCCSQITYQHPCVTEYAYCITIEL